MKRNLSYDFLDKKIVSEKFIDYNNKNITIIHFLIPSIHCSSCIFHLENLPKYHKDILNVDVDFINKKIWIKFNNKKFKISDLAIILDQIGYSPSVNLDSFESLQQSKQKNNFHRKLFAKLAIIFFCFGNIMLLSIPEYTGSFSDPWYINHRYFFRYMILILVLPVFIISVLDHIKQAISGLQKNIINIDFSILIGIFVLFFWSFYEIFFDIGHGYFDSLASFSLFLLISKILQIHTHNKIYSFNRNYKSFFPILVTRIKNKKENKKLLSSLKKGDIILIRNEEIIPVDSLLIKGQAILDNSFITGESFLINKNVGDRIYAGSKQKGKAIYLKVIKNVDHSYLSLLWKNTTYNKKKYLNSITNNFIKYFTPFVLILSLSDGIYWYIKKDFYKILPTVFSILIITCPCALVLSSPLIYGSIINFFSQKGFYIKDIFTMEKISFIKTLVFDKTGTLTNPNKEKIDFVGLINNNEKKMIASLLNNSYHPLSQRLLSFLSIRNFYSIQNFREVLGKGLECKINNIEVKIGSPKYLNLKKLEDNNESVVAVSINRKFMGKFLIRNSYRKGIKKMLHNLKKNYEIVILSGDNNNSEKKYLKSILSKSCKILFNQSPKDKLNYIKKIQKNGKKVMMFGDGFNDCAALNQSEIGIAIADNPTNFFPSCDAFLQSNCLNKIFIFLKISRISTLLIIINFTISLFYNIIGLSYALIGKINPLISSILMPISSFSVIFFSVVSTWIISKKFKFNL